MSGDVAQASLLACLNPLCANEKTAPRLRTWCSIRARNGSRLEGAGGLRAYPGQERQRDPEFCGQLKLAREGRVGL